jgi:GDSL-like Lipase/Acylhydrolase family
MVKFAKYIAGHLLGLVSIGCCVLDLQLLIANPSPQPTAPIKATDPQPPIKKLPKVVFFGSSTTVGFGTTRGDRRWTTLLSRYLGWEEINEGLSGSTVSVALRDKELASVPSGLERWRSNVLARHPDRVVMLYGVNDAFRQISLGSASH